MEAAGMANGFKTTLTTEKYLEIPDYAVLIQNAVKEIGGNIELNVLDQGAYYGDAVYGKSPWLDSDMGITDYGHRGVPNVFLSAPLTQRRHLERGALQEQGVRHAGDRATSPSLDLESQRAAAGKIQTPAARRDADHLRLLLRLPDGDEEGRDRRPADGDGPPVPRHRRRSDVGKCSTAPRRHACGGACMAETGGAVPSRYPLLKRLLLSLVTLWLLSLMVFAGGQVLPGNVGRAMLGPVRRPARGRRPQSRDGHRPARCWSNTATGSRVSSSATWASPMPIARRSRRSCWHARLTIRPSWRWWRSCWWCRSAYLGGVIAALNRRTAGRPHHHRSSGCRPPSCRSSSPASS